MPQYQDALKLAVDKNYKDSLAKMNEALAAVEAQVGSESRFHIFLYYRMSALHMLLYDLEGVEQVHLKAINMADKLGVPKPENQGSVR